MRPSALLFASCLALTASCREGDRAAATRAAHAGPIGTPDERAKDRAARAVKKLAETLQARLLAALAEGGPAAAVRACSDEAKELTANVARENGARLGRSSLRLRNPKNAPPRWVAEWLDARGERGFEGVVATSTVVDTRSGRFARLIKPIEVGALCLQCHGPKETLAPEVVPVLAERYPDDRATGYATGDLRGAIWAEVEVRAK